MLKLATLIENPGEPVAETRYHDLGQLTALGYNALAIYETTGLAGLADAEVIASGDLRRWAANLFDHVGNTIRRARDVGLEVFLFYDVLVLPRSAAERDVGALSCRNRPNTLCPASDEAVELSADALASQLARWPDVAGIVLRFGDTDASRLPYLVGNDVYSPHCPRCSQFGRADRIVTILERFHRLVVERHGKRLIARAWNVRPNGMHDAPELARRIIERLPGEPGDERFMLSFKFTHTDFWRYQDWNPCSLLAGERPIIYELQCQREFEGKGGLPNWQAPLWRDGYPESRDTSAVHGLAEAARHVNLAGLWAWVRGGGWGGPFIKDETWVDANVYAAPKLADDPAADVSQLARRWVGERLSVSDKKVAAALVDVLEASSELVRQAFYIGPFAQGKADPWHPSADWIQDDLLDAQAAWRIIQRLPEDQLDAVVAEKHAAAEQLSAHRAALQRLVSDRRHRGLEPLVNSLVYGESLFEALRDLLAGLVAYRRHLKSSNGGASQIARQKLFEAQTHWNHHTQRFGSLPGVATAFRESHFWELTQQVLGEVSAEP